VVEGYVGVFLRVAEKLDCLSVMTLAVRLEIGNQPTNSFLHDKLTRSGQNACIFNRDLIFY
jgi:hypothetical protein